ncbi:YciI family protein [Cellulomonas soli]
MRFLVSVIDSETGTATPAELAAVDEFNERLQADGAWVLACGLAAPSASTVIDARDAQVVVEDGPAVPSARYVSGFWILEAPDRAAAHALATEASRCCHRTVELRQLLGS